MPEFRRSLELAVSPERAWKVVGDLDGVTRWIPGCTGAQVEGGRRLCTFADGHVQEERILDYSPGARSYRYEVVSGVPMRNARGRFAVETRGAGSAVVWDSAFEAPDATSAAGLERAWEGALEAVLAALGRAIEGTR